MTRSKWMAFLRGAAIPIKWAIVAAIAMLPMCCGFVLGLIWWVMNVIVAAFFEGFKRGRYLITQERPR